MKIVLKTTDMARFQIKKMAADVSADASSRLMKGSDSRNQGTGTQPFRAECRFLGASSQNLSLIHI